MSDADFRTPPLAGAPDDMGRDMLDDLLDDASWLALTDYLSGQASAESVAAIDARIAADPAYAALVEEMRAVLAIPFADFIDITADDPAVAAFGPARQPDLADESLVDIDAAWTAFAKTLLPVPTESGNATSMDATAHPATTAAQGNSSVPPSRVRTARRTPESWLGRKFGALWQTAPLLAIALPLFIVYLIGMRLDRHRHPRRYYHAGSVAQRVTLPDGSVATLEPGAYLSTGRTFLGNTGRRDLYMFGQAHFDVAPNLARPFVVHALELQATVLGTTFTLLSDTTAQVTVDVESGKVMLTLPGADGRMHTVGVLTRGEAQRVAALTRWMAQAGGLVGQAGVPPGEAIRIQDALIRSAARLMRPKP